MVVASRTFAEGEALKAVDATTALIAEKKGPTVIGSRFYKVIGVRNSPGGTRNERPHQAKV